MKKCRIKLHCHGMMGEILESYSMYVDTITSYVEDNIVKFIDEGANSVPSDALVFDYSNKLTKAVVDNLVQSYTLEGKSKLKRDGDFVVHKVELNFLK